MSSNYFKKRNEEIFSDERQLDLDYIYNNQIKYGPTMIDTLTFSFKHFKDSEILSILRPFGFDFQALKDGDQFIEKAGYKRLYICQNTHSTLKCSWIRLGHDEISVLSLTGNACGLLYSQGKMNTFLFSLYNLAKSFGLFGQVYTGERSFKCTRIDICKDCFTDLFHKLGMSDFGNVSQMFYSKKGLEVTPNISFLNGKIKDGWTLYFGQRRGASYIRIYDKRAEQKVNDERLPYWSRLEFEFKNKDETLHANDIYLSLIKGESLHKIFEKRCLDDFFMMHIAFDEKRKPKRDEAIIHPLWREFISAEWDNSEENLCFSKCLFFHDERKSFDTVKRLVSSLAPKVFAGKTIEQISFMLHDLFYSDKSYIIDNKKMCIYVYYRSKNSGSDFNSLKNDIPCLPVYVPSEKWDDISYMATNDNLSLDELLSFIDKANIDFYNQSFSFSEVSIL